MVFIVGLGPGHVDYILPKAIKVMEQSDVLVGFKRAIESLDFLLTKKEIKNSLEQIILFLKENMDKDIALVASGDPNFYGITEFIKKNYHGEFIVIPGISSYQYLMSKINESWQGAYLSSVHGREVDFISAVRAYEKSIWLTDKERNPRFLCNLLIENSINCELTIGENLSYENEKITAGYPNQLVKDDYSNLSVVFINKKLE